MKKQPCKVWTFWEALEIWKNLPRGFDKSADLLSKRQNHKEDFFENFVLPRKAENFNFKHSGLIIVAMFLNKLICVQNNHGV